MAIGLREPTTTKPTHEWLRKIGVAFVPGPTTPLLESVVSDLLDQFRRQGHRVQDVPTAETDIILTTAPFADPLNWREAVLFTARRRFGLDHTPTIYTLIHAAPAPFQERLDYFERVLVKEPPDPADYALPGLAPDAYRTLVEQGRRGGPIMALERLLQAQSKSIRIVLVVGEDRPREAYTFDLVGAFPRTPGDDPEFFYEDLVLRLTTSVSTTEVTHHEVLEGVIPQATWSGLAAPKAMGVAGRELGQRNFFTHMVRVEDLVHVPAVADSVASQYSEGCFATWEPKLNALIATVTGSARPVDKERITEDELAVIVGVRADGSGAQVRHVEKKRNDPPSSEAVEMMDMDYGLPYVELGAEWGEDASTRVPIVRSKLHGHRGVVSYDPNRVEFVRLDPPYYHYPVSCATEAQARGIKSAFARSEALRNPNDRREVAFTVLPGHGVVMVEKWVPGKVPFQVLWEFMDAGYLRVENRVPQGPLGYLPATGGKMTLRSEG
jgi:hypothetical protein